MTKKFYLKSNGNKYNLLLSVLFNITLKVSVKTKDNSINIKIHTNRKGEIKLMLFTSNITVQKTQRGFFKLLKLIERINNKNNTEKIKYILYISNGAVSCTVGTKY